MAGTAEGEGLDIGPVRLLERERELEVLDRGIAGARAGHSGLVLIEGPAGIGKSRLVAEARRRAMERGLLVLSARGSELERDFPFGSCASCSSRASPTMACANASSPAPPRRPPQSSASPESGPTTPPRVDLRVAPRPLLADGEPEHGSSAPARG
jgi:hypothetical protein